MLNLHVQEFGSSSRLLVGPDACGSLITPLTKPQIVIRQAPKLPFAGSFLSCSSVLETVSSANVRLSLLLHSVLRCPELSVCVPNIGCAVKNI